MDSLPATAAEDISFHNIESVIERHAFLALGRDHADSHDIMTWIEAALAGSSTRRNDFVAPVAAKKTSLTSKQPSSGSPVGGHVKRAMDIAIAATTLFLMAPIMLIVAALIRLTQGGSVVFAQPRVGYGRQMFRCFKFRTMVPDAAERLAAHLAANPEAAREWQETQKLKNDPRITMLGRFLRKSSLDELPQLFNVLRGEMSCIGPRPVVADELARYGAYAEEYAMARPGLTGIWQVSGRSSTTYAQRVQLDRYYARRWSLALDLKILFMTVPAVIKISQTA